MPTAAARAAHVDRSGGRNTGSARCAAAETAAVKPSPQATAAASAGALDDTVMLPRDVLVVCVGSVTAR